MANKKPLTKRRKAEMEEKAKRDAKIKKIKILCWIGGAVVLAAVVTLLAILLSGSEPEYEKVATIQIKDKGTVVVRLDEENAATAVKKFTDLANKGTYNNTTFFEMSNGQLFGGSAKGESAAFYAALEGGSNTKGVISLAGLSSNTVKTDSFFINLKDNAHLNSTSLEFGTVISGLEILESLTVSDDSQPIIESITISDREVKK